jgi:predicted nuclease of predicted toxin-antitoxin system
MRPRWLLNENIPLPAVARLRAAGWDITSIAEDAPSIIDPDVMALARAEGLWLATFDRDYGELVFRRNLAPPPVILLLRVTSYRPDEPAEWIESLHASGELVPGSFHIFDGRTIRRRPFLCVAGGSHP